MARRFIGLSIADTEVLSSRCAECVYWETSAPLAPECGVACDGEAAREWKRIVAAEWGEIGRVAMQDGEVLGFIKYAPARYLPQSRHMPSGPPLDDAVLIACMHIAPEARRHGLGGVLLREALRDLAGRGERTVQAYALARRQDFESVPMVGVEFFLRHGFTVVRPHPEIPLLKLDLKSLVMWADNLETMLDSLRIPVAVGRRAPAPLTLRREDR